MPKKRNFLGGMQNYDPKTGEYEPDLKGPNGERPSSFGNFKKGDEKKSQHDKINAKRMGEDVEYDEDYERSWGPKEEDDEEVSDEDISEHLADFSWQIGDGETIGGYAQSCAERMGISKERVMSVIRKENPDVDENTIASKFFGLEDEEDKSFEAINEKRMNGKENLKNKIEEWKKNNPDGKVEENVDIESLKEKNGNEALALIEQIRKNTSYEDLGKKGLSMTDDEKTTYQEYKNKIDVLTEVAKADNIKEKANEKLSIIKNNLRNAKDIKQRIDNGDASEEDERYYNELLDKKQILTTLLENLNEDLGSQKGKSSKFKELNNKRMGNDKLPF